MILTRKLSSLSKNDLNEVGGKALSLGKLIKKGMLVPDGFVVVASAFNLFLSQNNIKSEVFKQLRNLKNNANSIRHVSSKISSLIRNGNISSELHVELQDECENLNSRYFAVRSSSVVEDSNHLTWAGQFDTFLNVDAGEIDKALKNVWCSFFSERALSYRLEHKIKSVNIASAVIIQDMVNGEKSGVAFSTHPVTEDPDQVIIEAVRGSGDKLVSGKKTPNLYVVSKKTKKVLYKNNFGKVGDDNKVNVLSNRDVEKVRESVLIAEKVFGTPQDVEWTMLGRDLYIIQSRPITTLSNKKGFVSSGKHVFFTGKIILSILSMELWLEAIKRNNGVEFDVQVKNDPIFFHRKNQDYGLYYNSEYISAITSSSFLNDRDRYKKYSAAFKVANEDLKFVFQGINKDKIEIGVIKNVLQCITNVFHYLDYFNFLRDNLKSSRFTDSEKKEILDLRIYSEKIIHDAFCVILDVANNILHKFNHSTKKYRKDIYLADYIGVRDLLRVFSGDKTKIKKVLSVAVSLASQNIFAYYEKKIYVEKSAELLLKKFTNSDVSSDKNMHKHGTQKFLYGHSAMSGESSGKVVIVKNWADINKVNRSQTPVILACVDLTPEIYSTLDMKKVCGIVCETGSVLCHAAIVAREHNVPAVIGVSKLTTYIKDDDTCEIISNGKISLVAISTKNK